MCNIYNLLLNKTRLQGTLLAWKIENLKQPTKSIDDLLVIADDIKTKIKKVLGDPDDEFFLLGKLQTCLADCFFKDSGSFQSAGPRLDQIMGAVHETIWGCIMSKDLIFSSPPGFNAK